ncbi:MAG: RNA 2',3'-cyclic phosphodiesterase [Anaerolineaceae bacterium]|nr:RNA 2',3'-cyclic phosphodiesterase [Anaerolineaceae bacterium]
MAGTQAPLRLFVALELPPALRQRLAALPLDLPGLRRVPPQQLHVTLYFIGNSEQTESIGEALAWVEAAPVSLALQGSGRWSGVLWAGLRQNAALNDLHRGVTQALGSCGLKPERRPFRPHVTLGRFRAQRPPARLKAWLRTWRSLHSSPVVVDEFCLYASELTPAGARYHILQRYPLRAKVEA